MKRFLAMMTVAAISFTLTACGTQRDEAGSAAPERTLAETGSMAAGQNALPDEQEESQPFSAAKVLTTNGGAEIALPSLEYLTDSGDAPAVYYISDITSEAMVEIYNALEWSPTGRMAVKLSTGEPPASNYLRPELIADLVKLVDGTIVECNTAYGGSRASTAMHYQVAEDHGFTAIGLGSRTYRLIDLD